MTDYSKSTVAALRQLLKDRSISATGLTRKAQIIDKLQEHDKERDAATAEPETPPAASQPEVAEEAQETREKDPMASTPARPDPAEEPASMVESQPRLVPDTATEAPPKEAGISTDHIPPAEEVAPTAPDQPSLPDEAASALFEEQHVPTQEDASPAPETHHTPTISDPAHEPAQPPQAEPQTQAVDTDMRAKTPSPGPNEKPSVEKPELLPIPEGSVDTTAEASRLNTEELEADTRKRKRRSGSPELATQEIKAKKQRPSQDAAPEVHLKEDTDLVMEQRRPELEPEVGTVVEDAKDEARNGTSDVESKTKGDTKSIALERKEKAPRYKELFEPAAPSPVNELLVDDRPILPALHPATPAVYIRNFMRPLKPEPLRAHLVSLATSPSADPDPSILKTLFLDSMKTHALVLFSSTTAASRVRASLHGSIWPAEGNRKELWVDFVPEDSVESWIQSEEDAINAEKAAREARNPIPTKRFEVVYPDAGDGVRAVFQEVGSGGGNAPLNAPRGPKSHFEQRRDIPPPRPQQFPVVADEDARKDLGQSFQTLDSLFESTTAKPKLYFLPVEDKKSAARLEELDKVTNRDWSPEDRIRGRGRNRRQDEKLKFSFDSEDRLVEAGPDHGPWAADSAGFSSGFRGGRGGGGRGSGGFGGGGFRGDGYRGGGGFRGGRGWRG
ncbi:hypothetical protein K505DRAFT_330567 [Melanomma pulvis-pyrius CBS 109.77]|uniref:SAP domain-containing protein n=1 Tax=Melanomma pulvis-pyrius CBS 109.77 TaxID=1314802 RepID=A0A6A6WQG5_9PLEO|nr:hypothetical protein K505DRAFT_330567 [Melanomma pulvis-pyrius CBS 109.77]